MRYRRPGVVGVRSSSASRSWGESKVGEKSTRSGKRSHSLLVRHAQAGMKRSRRCERNWWRERTVKLDFALRGVG